MSICVMITTRNRCDDLRRTLTALRLQCPKPHEVLITADGCVDKTVDMVREEFPECVLIINVSGVGSVAARDRMLRMTGCEYVVSLDDDSYPTNPEFCGNIYGILAAHPEAAVITFPELRDGGEFAGPSKRPESPGHYAAAYPNCAAVMRREFYLRQPGFPAFFEHMYEETDFALQAYAAGSSIWFEPSLTIRHHLSVVQRVPIRRHHQNARNELWSVALRCPFPWVVPVALFRICRQFQYAFSNGISWVLREPIWWCSMLCGLPRCWRQRQPVPWFRYLGWMRLSRTLVTTTSDLAKLLCDR